MMSTSSVELPRTQAVSERGFLGVSALLFLASTAATVAWCTSMSGMGEMPMPGGWTLSLAWMPMCGQTWLGTAGSFLGMWGVMMVAMMSPSLVPMLRGYRHSVRMAGDLCLGVLTTLAGLGYFAVWAAFGVVAFAFGATLVVLEVRWPMLARAIPALAGIVVLGAGVFQFSAWKTHQLACCREAAGDNCALSVGVGAAWRHGVRLGLHCCGACAGLTAILLATGVADLRVMAVVAVAITGERLAPGGEAVSRVIGVIATVVGVFLTVQAATLG